MTCIAPSLLLLKQLKRLVTLASFAYALLNVAGLQAQNYTISGYIEDVSSKERLIGVNVFLKGTSYGTSTNTFGFYSLTVPKGQYVLMASFIGFQGQRDTIVLNANLSRDFQLTESKETLDEVVVRAEELPADQVQMSTVRLSVPDIKKIPAFMGEVDIIRAIQLLPGVQSGGEGSTGFYVRGGSPDQNLILLDGVPVYNASHLFGFFSVFNADAIKNVQLTKGGFPARYGGRLSSVLEIDMKEGNLKEFHGEGSIGLIASKLTLEGPLIKDKTSFIISGRRTYYDVLTRPFMPQGTKAGYYFGDLNVKLNHIVSRKDRLYLSYYNGLDKFYLKEEYGSGGSFTGNNVIEETYENSLKWGNHTGSLRWNHLFGEKLFGNLTATFTQYQFKVGAEDYSKYYNETGAIQEENFGFEYYSLIRDYGLRYDLEYSLNSDHSLRMGASYTYHTFKPGVAQIQEEYSDIKVDSLQNLSKPIFANDIFAYIEDDWRINSRWRANYGLHYSAYFTNEAFYHSLQPRVSARYLISDDWSLKGSYALMNQYIHLLSNSGIGLPTDLWVSSTDKVKPQRSQQIAMGSTRNIKGNMYELSAEVYYKWMNNLIEYKEGASFLSTTDWENTVETDGKGEAYGLELLVRKNEGKTTGWIGYTLSYTFREFDNLNNGNKYPYKYDRRHDISIVVNHAFSKRFDIGATWVYGSGNTYTSPVSNIYLGHDFGRNFTNSSPNTYQRYSDRNGLRMPAYHRLDLGVNFHKKTKWGKRTWNISVYNAYSRRNPYFIYIDSDANSSNKKVKQVSLFPIIPSVSYIFSF